MKKYLLITLFLTIGIIYLYSTSVSTIKKIPVPNKPISEMHLAKNFPFSIKLSHKQDQDDVLKLLRNIKIVDKNLPSRIGLGISVQITFKDRTTFSTNILGNYICYSYNNQSTWCEIKDLDSDKLLKIFDKNLIDPSNDDYDNNTPGRVEFKAPATDAKIYKNNLVYLNPNAGLEFVQILPKKTVITLSKEPAAIKGFSIYEDKIVWCTNDISSSGVSSIKTTNPLSRLYLYDIKTKKKYCLVSTTSTKINPRIYKENIIWQESFNNKSNQTPRKYALYSYNLTTNKKTKLIKTSGSQENPEIYENKIVFEYKTGNRSSIYLYDLQSKKLNQISSSEGFNTDPDIYYSNIIWHTSQNSLMLYNSLSKISKTLIDDVAKEVTPSIHSGFISYAIKQNKMCIPSIYRLHTEIANRFDYSLNLSSTDLSSKWLALVTNRNSNSEVLICRYR